MIRKKGGNITQAGTSTRKKNATVKIGKRLKND